VTQCLEFRDQRGGKLAREELSIVAHIGRIGSLVRDRRSDRDGSLSGRRGDRSSGDARGGVIGARGRPERPGDGRALAAEEEDNGELMGRTGEVDSLCGWGTESTETISCTGQGAEVGDVDGSSGGAGWSAAEESRGIGFARRGR
jgi:hypothetical protein